MSNQKDAELILQVQKGSLEALGLLYDRHRQLVSCCVWDNGHANTCDQTLFKFATDYHGFARIFDIVKDCYRNFQ